MSVKTVKKKDKAIKRLEEKGEKMWEALSPILKDARGYGDSSETDIFANSDRRFVSGQDTANELQVRSGTIGNLKGYMESSENAKEVLDTVQNETSNYIVKVSNCKKIPTYLDSTLVSHIGLQTQRATEAAEEIKDEEDKDAEEEEKKKIKASSTKSNYKAFLAEKKKKKEGAEAEEKAEEKKFKTLKKSDPRAYKREMAIAKGKKKDAKAMKSAEGMLELTYGKAADDNKTIGNGIIDGSFELDDENGEKVGINTTHTAAMSVEGMRTEGFTSSRTANRESAEHASSLFAGETVTTKDGAERSRMKFIRHGCTYGSSEGAALEVIALGAIQQHGLDKLLETRWNDNKKGNPLEVKLSSVQLLTEGMLSDGDMAEKQIKEFEALAENKPLMIPNQTPS